MELKTGNFEINAEGFFTKSNYRFCPDKWGVKVGSFLNLGNLAIKADYQLNGTNYDREIKNQSSLNVRANLRF